MTMSSTRLRGVAGAPGLALGRAYVLRTDNEPPTVSDRAATPPDAVREMQRWHSARQQVEDALRRLAERARASVGTAEAEIFEAQALMVADPTLEEQLSAAVADGSSAEQATREAIAGFAAQFGEMKDAYLRQRADDVQEVGRALLRALAGRPPLGMPELPPGTILCATELAAGALVMLDRSTLAGLALGTGGVTSHIAILARTLNIPAVLGIGDFVAQVTDGELIGVDGTRGEVILDLVGEELAGFRRAVSAFAAERAELVSMANLPATTPDGLHLDLWANVAGLDDVAPALAAGAEGVGLFRTEFLITGRETLPSEDEQTDIYRRVLEAAGKRTVVIRTFDIGGDKPVPALGLRHEANPFLGYRAIRIGLGHPELLRVQLRAILGAAQGGHSVWIMLPMVARVEEVRLVRAVLDSVREPIDQHVRLGIMVETPAAALIAKTLAPEVDFFSIGTNDLTQYTLAADRTDERLADLYQPFHPAVLRLIEMTARAAETAGIPCGVCGEMAGDPRATALLIGSGVRELSMSAGSLGLIRREVRRTPRASAVELAHGALVLATADEVLAHVEAFRATLQS
jgi:phosphoenolpyruvate-protein phosphotransferase (PTS system enzyme I)